jgi:hypothetical protein
MMLSACECETSFASCHEVGASDLVFIGTVQSIEPIFMNRWYMANQSPMRSLNDAYADAQQHPSAAALARLKDTYLNIFPGLAPDEKRRLQGAGTIHDVASLFYSALDRGMRVRLKVRTLFKHQEDDDAKKKEPDFFDVWTTFDSCGFDFQIGETYLVYANNDEFGAYYFTGSCTRTKRVSDAGEDLSYLFFYKDHPEESARLEGFTTTERLDFDPLHDPETVKSPVAGVIVELKSDRSPALRAIGREWQVPFRRSWGRRLSGVRLRQRLPVEHAIVGRSKAAACKSNQLRPPDPSIA